MTPPAPSPSVLDDLAGEAEAGLSFTRLALAAPPERLALLEPVLTGHAQFCEPALGLEWADFEKRGLRAVSGRYQALQAHAWFLAVRSVLEAILRQIGALAELEQAEAEGRDFDPVPRSSTRFAMLGGTRAELERLLELGPGVFGRQGVLARARELAGHGGHLLAPD